MRKAAPFVAEESGLRTNVTCAATLLWLGEAFQQLSRFL
jgi:hypothetical protein